MQHITDSVTVMTSGHQAFHFFLFIFRVLEFKVERKSLLLEILLHYLSVLYVFLVRVLPFPKTVEPNSLVFYFGVGKNMKILAS